MRVTDERLKARVEQLRKQGVKVRPILDPIANQNQEAPETSTKTHTDNDAEVQGAHKACATESVLPAS